MTAGVAVMSEPIGSEPEARVGFGVFIAALASSLAAGATGLALALGQGALELPGLVAVALVYAALPGVLALALLHRLFSARQMPAWQRVAAYVMFAAFAAVVWFLLFAGLYVPLDRADALASAGEMALYHAASGAVGGLVFWLLTRRQP
jgi:hypothetical protein